MIKKLISKFSSIIDLNKKTNVAFLKSQYDRLVDEAKNKDTRIISSFGFKVYSQFDEDGIIEEIFKRIGTTNKVFIEF